MNGGLVIIHILDVMVYGFVQTVWMNLIVRTPTVYQMNTNVCIDKGTDPTLSVCQWSICTISISTIVREIYIIIFNVQPFSTIEPTIT